ncbi:MAG: DNA-3-methyladenine glycosylase [Acidobacteria bacterium]|nr:DNA-3-methyladenine glycosylase [Acidobacteriota bacterium]
MSAVERERLSREFFYKPTLEVSRKLLGKRLVRVTERTVLSGWIVETEAYIGTTDLACHARSGKTPRNEIMWGPAGFAYVYFTYGMHWLLNVVTEASDFPAAVLLRALLLDVECPSTKEQNGLIDGPARVCKTLEIEGAMNGHDLCTPHARLYLENAPDVPPRFIANGSRIGLFSVPEPWKSIPWRFRITREGLGKLKRRNHNSI